MSIAFVRFPRASGDRPFPKLSEKFSKVVPPRERG